MALYDALLRVGRVLRLIPKSGSNTGVVLRTDIAPAAVRLEVVSEDAGNPNVSLDIRPAGTGQLLVNGSTVGGGGVSDGDKGDVVVSSSGSVWTLDPAVVTSFIRTLLDDANAAAARATLGLAVGTDVQAQDPELQAIAGLASAANKLPYFTGSAAAALADFTSFGRSLVDDADATAGRTTLGLGSMATQASSSVAITGGTIAGTTIDGVSIKAYVDNLVAGLIWKESVRAASTADLDKSVDVEAGDTIDGVALAAGDRILLKDQSNQDENGIYVVQSSGSPIRADDADTGEKLSGACVVVREGTVNADRAFICTSDSITIDSSTIEFVNFVAAINGALIAGNNLSDLTNTAQARVNIGLSAAAGDLAGTYPAPEVAKVSKTLTLSGALTAPTLSANQNDYNPTGLSDALVLNLSSSAAVTITGLAGGSTGRLLIVRNAGANPITLTHFDAASSGGNKFYFPSLASVRIDRGQALILYHSTYWTSLSAADASSNGVAGLVRLNGDASSVLAGDGSMSKVTPHIFGASRTIAGGDSLSISRYVEVSPTFTLTVESDADLEIT